MLTFWIAAIVVTNITTATICLYKKNTTPEPTLLEKITETETPVWREGFDNGWNAALNDFTAIRNAWTRMTAPK